MNSPSRTYYYSVSKKLGIDFFFQKTATDVDVSSENYPNTRDVLNTPGLEIEMNKLAKVKQHAKSACSVFPNV